MVVVSNSSYPSFIVLFEPTMIDHTHDEYSNHYTADIVLFEPTMIDHTHDEYSNHYTADAVQQRNCDYLFSYSYFND
jgi:hypothetical protein